MSILDRLNLLVRSNLNSNLRKQGSGSGRKALSEMESSLRDARREQAQLRRGEKELIAQIRQARERSEQWEDRAMMALRSDDEDLAREALIVKNEALNNARRLHEQLDDHRSHMQDIERALEALEHKLDGTRNRMKALSKGKPSSRRSTSGRASSGGDESKWDQEFRRRTRASTDGPAHSTEDFESSETFDTSGKFREMDRMAGKIDGMEAEVEAMRELGDIGGDSRKAELERHFRKLEQKSQSSSDRRDKKRDRSDEPLPDDDLADLKKKFE